MPIYLPIYLSFFRCSFCSLVVGVFSRFLVFSFVFSSFLALSRISLPYLVFSRDISSSLALSRISSRYLASPRVISYFLALSRISSRYLVFSRGFSSSLAFSCLFFVIARLFLLFLVFLARSSLPR